MASKFDDYTDLLEVLGPSPYPEDGSPGIPLDPPPSRPRTVSDEEMAQRLSFDMPSCPDACPELEQEPGIAAFKWFAVKSWNPTMSREEREAEYWRQEQVRLFDAWESLSSPLYRAKAERLGLLEYYRQHNAGRGW